jgi:drug/metabolite transporter (DMT)-like permease
VVPAQPGHDGVSIVRLEVVVLALTASVFTALASVAQRRAAAPAPAEGRPSLRLIEYLLHRPVWFLGIACMILGFVFQVAALRMGSLSLVQPIIATELVLVFGFIALRGRHTVRTGDWLSALGVAASLRVFLTLAKPGGGHDHASGFMWILAGSATIGLAAVLTAAAYFSGAHGTRSSSGRKAALLGIAAATGFGFVAAVIKELSTHFAQGPSAVFSNWSPYVLLLSGAASMFLASHAFQAGSLAASQPGLTVVDPLVASVLGVVLFGERLDLAPVALAGEVVALTVLVGSVILLSRSPLVRADDPFLAAEPDAPERSQGAGGGSGPVALPPRYRPIEAGSSALHVFRHRRSVRDVGDPQHRRAIARLSR